MFNLMIGSITLLFFVAFMTIFLTNRQLQAAGWISAAFLFGLAGQILAQSSFQIGGYPVITLSRPAFLAACICLVMAYASRTQIQPNLKMMGAIFFIAFALINATAIMPLRAIVMECAAASLLLCGLPVFAGRRDQYTNNLLFWFNIVSVCIFLLRPIILLADIHPDAWPSSFVFYQAIFYLSSSIISVVGANIIFVALGSDLIERHQKAAMIDPLTGLLNRRGMQEIFRDMDEDMDKAKYTGRAMLMFDIDHFKQVNDEYGHEVGDTVLTNIGATVQQLTKHHGQVARSGGEEFMFLFNAESSPAAFLVAEHLRVAISLLKHEGLPEDSRVTASFGLAFIRENELAKRLVRRADLAMYAAKDAGRNRLRLADGDSLPDIDETLQLPRVRSA